MRALVVHGGAGSTARDPEASQAACARGLATGWAVLERGGSALDAVVAAVGRLEDEPALNAGLGACLTEDGTVELDASVMEGTARAAGAVALVRRIPNPIRVARLLLEDGRHVMMAGAAAERFAAARGVQLVDPASLVTPARAEAWRERQARAAADRKPDGDGHDRGTVGAVAIDRDGRVAAATSTGGIAWKRAGRIGDSAVIGAGTFADDRAGAASATGDGEAIMRATLARVAVEHLARGLAPERAAATALAEVTALGGEAGIIVVDRFGRVAAVHTTPHITFATRSA